MGVADTRATGAAGPPPAYPIASVGNALRVLELLAGGEPLTLTSISRALGVAPSTAHRLLAMLLHHGFVRQEHGAKAYRPGATLLRIALAATGGVEARAVARPSLEALGRRLDETVHLVMLDGASAVFLDSVESRRAVRVSSRAGATMPAHCTSAGKAALAQLDDGELRARLGPDPLPGLTDRSATTLAQVRRNLRAARNAGYATNAGESEDGLVAVGAAVPARSGEPRLAISVSIPAVRLEKRRAAVLAPAVIEAAAEIGERLASAQRTAAVAPA